MAVTTLQQPSEIDLAYGPVIVTLSNIDATADKYAIRILDETSTQIGFITQSPNEVNRAQFDIRKIVQNIVKAGTAYDESFGSRTTGKPFRVGGPEIGKYFIEVGVEVNGIFGDYDANDEFVPNGQTSLGEFVIMNGSKPYFARDWFNIEDQYMQGWSMQADGFGNLCPSLDDQPNGDVYDARALTDSPSNAYQDGANEVPGWPRPQYAESQWQYCNVLYDRDMPWQVSWIQKQIKDTEGSPLPAELVGIEAVEIQEFDINQNLLTKTWIPNIIANGGGPNTSIGDGQALQYPYNVLNMQAGYNDLNGVNYTDANDIAQTFNFNTNTYFYFLIPRVYAATGSTCNLGTGGLPLSDDPARRYYGFYINKGNECLINPVNTDVAYQNKLQFKNLTSAYGTWRNNGESIWNPNPRDPLSNWTLFSWMNSFGYRDYWYFFGDRDIKVKTKRDTYKRSHNDFNGALWDVEGDARGETQFAGEQHMEVTVKSGYFPYHYWTQTAGSDHDFASTLMQSLFTSADVRVYMAGHQAIDYLTDSKKMHQDLPETWNKWEPVVVTNKDYEFKQSLKEGKLYNYEITFKMANKTSKASGEHA